MADGDERTRTRRPAAASTDPRDETGATARAGSRPISTGRARAARAGRPPDDPLARLQALHPTTNAAPASPVVVPPATTPPLAPPAAPTPRSATPATAPASGAAAAPGGPSSRVDRARARAHRRGATSEVPATGAPRDEVGTSDAAADDAGAATASRREGGEVASPSATAPATAPAAAPVPAPGDPGLRRLGGIDLTDDLTDDLGDDLGSAGTAPGRAVGGSRGLVLPVEPVAPAPRLLLPTGRIPRIGQDRPNPVSDLPLIGIEPAERDPSVGTVVVPELDPSGEIVRDGTGTERRTLRDRLEPVLVRRPRPRVRRVTRVVRHLDTWSVFKVALVFNLVVFVVCLTAGVLLWNVADTTGTIDNVEQFFEQFGWEHFEFHGGEIYHHAWIAGLFATIGLTGLAVLVATLFNLITDLVGGIRVSVLEEEVIERVPHRRRTASVRRSRRREAPIEDLGSRPLDHSTGELPVTRPDA